MKLYDIYDCGHVETRIVSSEKRYKEDKIRIKGHVTTFCKFCGFIKVINVLPEKQYQRKMKILNINENTNNT